jgi:hypothetical protein
MGEATVGEKQEPPASAELCKTIPQDFWNTGLTGLSSDFSRLIHARVEHSGCAYG